MKGILVQVAATLVLSIGNFLVGFSIAWPSFALPVLQSDESPTGSPITELEANLVGSLIMLGNFISTPFSGWTSDVVGKKKASILCALGLTLSWAIIITAKSIYVLLVGRFICGLAEGIYCVICLPFIGEISNDSIRGTLSSLLGSTYSFGVLLAYVTGWLCSYDVVNYINLVLSVLYVVLMCFLEETPPFLVEKRRDKDALKSLKFYRGSSQATPKILEELASLQRVRDSDIEVTNADLTSDAEKSSPDEAEKEILNQIDGFTTRRGPWKMLCSSKPAQRALFIITLHIVLLILGGTIAVTTYASQLFAKAAPGISNERCSVVLAVAFAVGSVLAMVFCDLVGRRTLMLFSTIVSATFLGLLASLLRWPWAPEWAIPASVLGYCCFFQMGTASVPFIQCTECFVHKLKNTASMVVGIACCLVNFLVLALFPPAVALIGLEGVFLVFSLILVLLTVSSYFLMRETKGVPVEEVEKMFESGLMYRKIK